MERASTEGMKPTLSQSFLGLLIDSLAFAIYFSVAYLVISKFYKIHWILGLIYLIPFVWGYFLFLVGPLAEDGQTPGQRSTNTLVFRKDGKEYKKDGSTGGIGYTRSTLVWVISRGIFPALGAIVLFTNFSYANLILVVVVYLLSLLLFATVEDSLFGLSKVHFARESAVRATVRGFFEKSKLPRPQLPSHAALIPYLMLVGGLFIAIYGALKYQVNHQAAIAGIVIGILSIGVGQSLLNVRRWSRWVAVVFLVAAAVVTFLYSFSPIQTAVTTFLCLVFILDLVANPSVANAFRSVS
ncbi:MAG: hypothetical protein ONB23_00595 [candidate division KSB1 bacterium]|nr:hypothetical protein [candidate division KSB1 bacterium]